MHISVLLKESIESLNIKEDKTYVDATLGYAGHASEILKRITRGCLFAFDQDKIAIEFANLKLKSISDNYTIIKSNFKNMKVELNKRGVYSVDGILFDLGVSSPQLDEENRGFSYHKDALLDMRMDLDSELTAMDIVNNYSLEELSTIFYRYGEEKYSKSIAKNIVKDRNIKKITTTFELVEIIKKSMPEKAKRDKHPARKVFQAIRIEVNHELDILEQSLRDAASLLKINGRLSVITFHSLEDKIVKKLFSDLTAENKLVKGLPNIPIEYLPNYKLIANISPSKEEIEANNRSRSSRLRVIEKIR